MAKLYFYYSSMNAGKSTDLLRADFNYRERDLRTSLWTSALDTRLGGGRIVSRIGLQAKAAVFAADTDLLATVAADHAGAPLACVLVDEAQWLSPDQVWQLARVADELGVPVLCYGLRTDFRGALFPGAGALLGPGRRARGTEGGVSLRPQGDDEPAGGCGWRSGPERRADGGGR